MVCALVIFLVAMTERLIKSKAEKEGWILGDGLRAYSMTAEDLEVMVTLCLLLKQRER